MVGCSTLVKWNSKLGFKRLCRESSDLTITIDDSRLKLQFLSVIFRLEFRNVRFLVRLYLFRSTLFLFLRQDDVTVSSVRVSLALGTFQFALGTITITVQSLFEHFAS